MFQIAFIKSFGRRHGLRSGLNGIDANLRHLTHAYNRSPHAYEYLRIFKNLDWWENFDDLYEVNRNKAVPFHYVPIQPEDNTNYLGYFQSERYFTDSEYVKWLFQPADWVEERIEKYDWLFKDTTTCSIHVRRGDYKTIQEFHPLMEEEYYQRAISGLNHLKIGKFAIFSDDIDYCRELFKGDEYVFIKDRDYTELFVMAKCDHHIIANSSFSWWGAWLGERQGSVTIAPETWFGSECKDNPMDIIPARWQKI